MNSTSDKAGNAVSASATFWSGVHCGRQIAASHHSNGWVVYIDRVMQMNRTFGSPEDAIRWLQRKVEDAEFDTRAALFSAHHASRSRPAKRWAA